MSGELEGGKGVPPLGDFLCGERLHVEREAGRGEQLLDRLILSRPPVIRDWSGREYDLGVRLGVKCFELVLKVGAVLFDSGHGRQRVDPAFLGPVVEREDTA